MDAKSTVPPPSGASQPPPPPGSPPSQPPPPSGAPSRSISAGKALLLRAISIRDDTDIAAERMRGRAISRAISIRDDTGIAAAGRMRGCAASRDDGWDSVVTLKSGDVIALYSSVRGACTRRSAACPRVCPPARFASLSDAHTLSTMPPQCSLRSHRTLSPPGRHPTLRVMKVCTG